MKILAYLFKFRKYARSFAIVRTLESFFYLCTIRIHSTTVQVPPPDLSFLSLARI